MVPKKKQVVVIGGGETFDTYAEYLNFLKTQLTFNPDSKRKPGWKENLQKHLGRNYSVMYPKMPSPLNAKYMEWEIYFQKLVVPHLKSGTVLIGHSLGGIFLVRFLQEHKLKMKIGRVVLVSAPYNIHQSNVGMENFYTKPDFKLYDHAVIKTLILHSKDDPVVKYEDALQYEKAIANSHLVTFEGRGHFIFDERIDQLIRLIKVGT